MLSGAGDRSRPTWGPLFPGHQFKARNKTLPEVKASLFGDLFKDYV
jgi:hypothetical protein